MLKYLKNQNLILILRTQLNSKKFINILLIKLWIYSALNKYSNYS